MKYYVRLSYIIFFMIVTHLIVSGNSPVSFSNIISMEDIKAESMDGAKERERVDICSYIDHVQGRVGRASPPPGKPMTCPLGLYYIVLI